jgi:2-polyprenyl-3-methyl-5-hydroxy-6-metoxy-1,4-benzoquinol methylase
MVTGRKPIISRQRLNVLKRGVTLSKPNFLSKIRKLNWTLSGWSARLTYPLEIKTLQASLSPIDKYVVFSGLTNQDGLFHPSYEGWRIRRLNKMLEIYGIDFFKGKRIIEVGAGHGDIGAFFADLGADVLCLDGRIQNVNFARLKHRKVPGLRFETFNLEKDFSELGRFDLLIDFGLIYHLKNVDEHLDCCFAMADDIVLETVVCDSRDPHTILYRPGRADVDEEALDGTGSRPSPFYIERIAIARGFEIQRHFTADLNFERQFRYDWLHKDNSDPSDDFVLRRFWRFRKKGI